MAEAAVAEGGRCLRRGPDGAVLRHRVGQVPDGEREREPRRQHEGGAQRGRGAHEAPASAAAVRAGRRSKAPPPRAAHRGEAAEQLHQRHERKQQRRRQLEGGHRLRGCGSTRGRLREAGAHVDADVAPAPAARRLATTRWHRVGDALMAVGRLLQRGVSVQAAASVLLTLGGRGACPVTGSQALLAPVHALSIGAHHPLVVDSAVGLQLQAGQRTIAQVHQHLASRHREDLAVQEALGPGVDAARLVAGAVGCEALRGCGEQGYHGPDGVRG